MKKQHYNEYKTHKGRFYIDNDRKTNVVTSFDNSHLDNDKTVFSLHSHHTAKSDTLDSFYMVNGKIGEWRSNGAKTNKPISRIDIFPSHESKEIPEIEKIKLYIENNEMIELTSDSDIKKLTNALSDNMELELVNQPDDKYSFFLE